MGRIRVTIVAVQKQKYCILCLELVIQNAKPMSHYVAICGLPGCGASTDLLT